MIGVPIRDRKYRMCNGRSIGGALFLSLFLRYVLLPILLHYATGYLRYIHVSTLAAALRKVGYFTCRDWQDWQDWFMSLTNLKGGPRHY